MQFPLTKLDRYRRAVRGEPVDRPPIWIMRQAGRYLPEYQQMRQRWEFRDFCLNPEVSAEATLLPLQLLDVDILIIFNDILIPLEQMGLSVEFPGGGPVIEPPLRSREDLARFLPVSFADPPVCGSIRRTRELAGPDVPVLGFCGSPFTLALYAIEGRVSRNLTELKRMLYGEPDLLEEILERVTETAANYLVAQVLRGCATGVQLFESWGGILSQPRQYERFAARWQRELIRRFRAECPETPLHLYVRWSRGKLSEMEATGADVLGVDWMTPLAEARSATDRPLQGNLDPMALVRPQAVADEVKAMLTGFDPRRGFIANLGHGITPEADPEAARAFVRAIQRLAERSPV